MSRSTLLKVYKTKAIWDVELHNSHGTCPILWDFFFEKHCWDGNGWAQDSYGQGGASTFLRPFAIYHKKKDFDSIFSKLQDFSIPLHHRAGLFLTCDRVILEKKHLPLLIEPFKTLAIEMRGYAKPGYSNHWEAIAEYVASQAREGDSRMLGIALSGTSVSDVWDNYPDDVGVKGTSSELFNDKERA